ncbi:MAG: hypothetical protein IT343_09520 [Candidatus Melainabacteria bacterium]|jgi:chaperonin cofactor prefoldin|nr:hypothetical protein [Candidatus Melainabacteria bacterium]
MLFVFEILFLVVMGIIAIVTIVTVGRPLAIAYADKMKAKNLELDTERVEMRIAALEEETRELKRQLLSIQESSEFNDRLLEKGKG